jgi:hypothetical protein
MAASREIDLEREAKEIGLTEKQKQFCEYFIFVCGLDAEKAVELSEYEIGQENYKEKYAGKESLARYYMDLQIKRIARKLLNNVKIIRYINYLKDTLDSSLIIDKLWVVQKLKKLAEKGSEKTQLEATKLLGQTMSMFQPETIVSSIDDPGQIVRDAIAKRKREEEPIAGNLIEFGKGGVA